MHLNISGHMEKLSTTIKYEPLSGSSKSIWKRDHERSVSGYGLNFIGGALAAKAQPLYDFTKLSMFLSMQRQYT